VSKQVLVWNLERFGETPTNATEAGIRKNMIAALIFDLNVDVVLIQELHSRGIPWLGTVADRLTELEPAHVAKPWHFDWVKGGIDGTVDPTQVGFAQTTFKVTKSEGYGVLWRDGALNPIAGSGRSGGMDNPSSAAALAGASNYIDLCLRGYEMTHSGQTDESRLIMKAPKVKLPTGTFATQQRSAKEMHLPVQWSTNAKVLTQKNSRRAAFVTLTAGGKPYDVLVYHAPNMEHSTLYGPILAYSTYTLNDERAMGGDWNTVSKMARKALGYASDKSFGLDSPTLDDSGKTPLEPTMVHSTGRTKKHWLKDQAIYTNHRDYAVSTKGSIKIDVPDVASFFYKRPAGAPSATVFKLLGKQRMTILKQFKSQRGARAHWPKTTRDGYTNEDIIKAFFKCYKVFSGMSGINDAVWTDTMHNADFYTAFALLYNRYISDHRPILITIS
jgi:hypothetical protein